MQWLLYRVLRMWVLYQRFHCLYIIPYTAYTKRNPVATNHWSKCYHIGQTEIIQAGILGIGLKLTCVRSLV